MRWLLRWCGLGVVGLEACRGFGAGREEVKCRVRHLRLVLHLACCSLMSTMEPPSHVMPLSRCSRTGLASLTEQACLSRTPVDALAQRQLFCA